MALDSVRLPARPPCSPVRPLHDLTMSIDSLLEAAFHHHRERRLDDAETLYRSALESAPTQWGACLNLAQILTQTGRFDDATRWLTWRLQDAPDNVPAHRLLGLAHASASRPEAALLHLERVLEQQPDDSDTLQLVANLQQLLGRSTEADENFRRSLALQPLVTVPATQSPPSFRALLLFAPGGGNTPFAFLIENADFECHILNLLPDAPYDVDMLGATADIVINLVADVDHSAAVIPLARELVERLGKPVVNPPERIAATDRETIARRLRGIPHCRVPLTRRFSASELLGGGFELDETPFPFPFLARPAGTHGGADFERIHDQAELDAFVGQVGQTDYYLTHFVDYRSRDGFFRKYRFIFVNGQVLPYHLAIDDKWKIHHVTTDMANQQWMQDEERSFLEDPGSVFGVEQFDVLRAIQAEVGLDYFGIDCSLDADGQILVFEVNACMLVHQKNETFPYKVQPVERIKEAFRAMLTSKATSGR
jgi:Tetratricopeptide repeat